MWLWISNKPKTKFTFQNWNKQPKKQRNQAFQKWNINPRWCALVTLLITDRYFAWILRESGIATTRGHSITTWIKFYPILTIYTLPPSPLVNNCGHFSQFLPFVHMTKREIYTDHLPAPLLVHVVIGCPSTTTILAIVYKCVFRFGAKSLSVYLSEKFSHDRLFRTPTSKKYPSQTE